MARGLEEASGLAWGVLQNQRFFGVTISLLFPTLSGFPGGSTGKESACNVRDLGSIPGLGRSPGKGKATHSSILACRKESDTAERLSLSVPTCSALPEDENCFPYSNGLELQN